VDETQIANLIVRLTGDGSAYQRMLQQAERASQDAARKVENHARKIEGFQTALRGYAAAAVGGLASVGAVLGVQFVGGGFRQALDAFAQLESTQVRLQAALRASGEAVDSVMPHFNALADSLSAATTASKGSILGLEEQAEELGATVAQTEQAVKWALALAKGNAELAQTYVRGTVELARGNPMMLRYLLHLRGVRSESELMQRVQERINRGWAIAQAETGTVSGQIQRLRNAWNQLLVPLGKVVADVLMPAVTATTEWAQTLAGQLGPAWEAVKATVGDLLPLWRAITSLMGAVWDTAVQAAGALGRWLSSSVVDWQKFKDFAIDALITAEFGIRHFGDVAAYVWTRLQLNFVETTDGISFFFTATLPALLSWFGDNWQDVFKTAFNFVISANANMARSVVDTIKNIPGLIAGTVDWSEVLHPLTEGFINTVKSLPNIPEQQMSVLAQQLREQGIAQEKALGSSFEEFRKRKLEEFAAGVPPRALADAASAGIQLGEQFNKGAKSEVQKFDAALRGSAEALGRIAAYRDVLAGGRMAAGPMSAVEAGSAEGAGLEREQLSVQQKMLGKLDDIARKPGAVLQPAGLA
jgi:hypothetical protein